MQVVTDGGADLASEQLEGLNIHQVPFYIHMDGKSYRGWLDIQPENFYKLLESSRSFPTTSQPPVGEFVEFFKERAKDDKDIISINVTGGLSGTVNTARIAASMVPEANITVVDARTLSSAQGWQVIAAARAAAAGWSRENILALIERVQAATDGIFTLNTLKYVINGGRINQFAGMVASILSIKPVIGIDKKTGVLSLQDREFTFKRALMRITDVISRWHTAGSEMVFQVVHGNNPEGAALMRKWLDQIFKCTFFPIVEITPVFGCHSGPGVVGVIFAPTSIFSEIP
jgi:DegV family protein with EDD domain